MPFGARSPTRIISRISAAEGSLSRSVHRDGIVSMTAACRRRRATVMLSGDDCTYSRSQSLDTRNYSAAHPQRDADVVSQKFRVVNNRAQEEKILVGPIIVRVVDDPHLGIAAALLDHAARGTTGDCNARHLQICLYRESFRYGFKRDGIAARHLRTPVQS